MTPEDGANYQGSQNSGVPRRDFLKGLATIPVFGAFFYELAKKRAQDHYKKNEILAELGIGQEAPAVIPKTTMKPAGDLIRLGLIGFGSRGEDLMRSAGFAHPDWIENAKKAAQMNKLDNRLDDWLQQENLNIAITGVCDVFDVKAERGLAATKNEVHPGGSAGRLPHAKRYRDYHEMLQSNDIDGVIIATPDHHHAPITIAAAQAGKHVYCEKGMTRTEEEIALVVEAVKKSGVVFQLGHQYPQNACFAKAKELVEKNILGKITLIETTTNRNTPNGAWIRHLDGKGHPKPGSPETIDWDKWLGASPKVPFDLDRYYNWTKWWDYGTGLANQLFSHEYDAANQILGLGIPKSAVASGGIYFFKDNREIPDIFQAVLEFPDRDLTFVYSASLASSRSRGRVFMGHDAAMEVGDSLTVTVDTDSTRYQERILAGIIDPSLPLISYRPGAGSLDAVTSASQKYYASRGLIYTYREGRRVDVAHLHIKEWLNCIRNGGTPSCNIDKGFESAVACQMITKAYREQRRVEWDPAKRSIV
ncbi:MAG: Gfo/Idh/MocA family protein [bacterium]